MLEIDRNRRSETIKNEHYEIKLGHFIAQHPIALACAKLMAQRAWKYIQIRSQYFTTSRKQQAIELERLILACGQPLEESFAGRIGLSADRLSQVLQGNGNIREMVTHVWRFMNNIFSQDCVGPNRIEDVLAIAKQANFNVIEIQRMIWQAQCFHAASAQCDRATSISNLDPKDDFIKLPWNTVRQEQNNMRIMKASFDDVQAWSRLTRTEFEAEGGVLSATEKQLCSQLGTEYVPWMDGRNVWALEETHPFVQHARKAHLPLMTGISGFTVQIMQFAKLLNVSPDTHVRLVCLGYLLPIRSHSFHEIMSAAISFGCDYEEGNYRNLAPLTISERPNSPTNTHVNRCAANPNPTQ